MQPGSLRLVQYYPFPLMKLYLMQSSVDTPPTRTALKLPIRVCLVPNVSMDYGILVIVYSSHTLEILGKFYSEWHMTLWIILVLISPMLFFVTLITGCIGRSPHLIPLIVPSVLPD